MYDVIDSLRRAQGDALERLGYGPEETAYRIAGRGRLWRLRDYGGTAGGPPLLIVAAPIKRPYIWDLAPGASAVRWCRDRGFRVRLLEWEPPTDGAAGLADYAGGAIAEATAAVTQSSGDAAPLLIGHSLGGTLAAIFAALEPRRLAGLVLVGAPLCFAPGVSGFRDAIVALAPPALGGLDVVPGALLSQLSALAAPHSFVWSRLWEATAADAGGQVPALQARIERWALDEVALPGAFARDILRLLYRENRLCAGTLAIDGRTVGPGELALPLLAVVDAADEVAPAASVAPFLDAMPGGRGRLIEYPGEAGIGLQHLALLVGRRARAQVWPAIADWLHAVAAGAHKAAEAHATTADPV